MLAEYEVLCPKRVKYKLRQSGKGNSPHGVTVVLWVDELLFQPAEPKADCVFKFFKADVSQEPVFLSFIIGLKIGICQYYFFFQYIIFERCSHEVFI